MDRLVVPAPAKVNLFLHVTGRRADGYHLLESLFALVDLADTLTLTRRADGAIVREGGIEGLPPERDLVVRAAAALREHGACDDGVTIAVQKRIPVGGGLGGGSSDAASVLLALNRLWSLRLPRDELARIGLALGADVPFFIGGENALVRGIGERLSPVSLPASWLVLACPRVEVPTAAIFASPELTRSTPSAKINVFSESYGRNDLQPVAGAMFPAVANAVAMLSKASPSARMSGSGACAWARFDSEHEARRVCAALPKHVSGWVVRTLSRHPLQAFA